MMKAQTLTKFLAEREKLSNTRKAEILGISRPTLWRWLKFPDKVLIVKTKDGYDCYPMHDYGNQKRSK